MAAPIKLPPPNCRESLVPPTNGATGEQIKRSKPALYDQALTLLASPAHSLAEVSRITGLAGTTLRGIMHGNPALLDEKRRLLAARVEQTLRSLVERVDATADKMKPRDAIFGVSVFANQWHLLTGAATSHNLNVNVAGKPIDIAGQFDKLHAAIEAKAGRVLELETGVPIPDRGKDSHRDPARPPR